MKKSFLIVFVFLYTSVFAVEGYKDIYIKSNINIYVHTIYCAKNLSNASALRPSIVYTNTKNIEDGTYYIRSNAGEYSSTFKKIKGKPTSIRIRGILTKGQTSKKQMNKSVCLVEKNIQLPKNINARIVRDLIKSNDSSWNQKIQKYTSFYGKPAYSEGKYLSKR
mgnify:CR=1 FL=1